MCLVNKRCLGICNTKEKITSIESVYVSVCVVKVTTTSVQLLQQPGLCSPV